VSPHVLLIDNYDSFTYNLVQMLEVAGAKVTVVRNDRLPADALEDGDFTHLVISPGPGRPEDAGVSVSLVAEARGRVPTLGVCLGHQAIAIDAGIGVGPARALMHGKTSDVHHDGTGLFAGLPQPFTAGRYHSLAAEEPTPDSGLVVTARTADGEVMAFERPGEGVFGVQFHPESILTPEGATLLSNFLGQTIASPSTPSTGHP